MPHTQVVPIKHSATGAQYELYVKLPKSYHEKQDVKYPVIYFTDAVWHIEALSAATSFLMENVILVGISWQIDIPEEQQQALGAHASRYRDYTFNPSDDPDIQAKYQLGQANNHLAFIRNDVIPHVESLYRTDSQNRSYFGYSAGGLFGLYVLLSQPDTFNHYLLGSPSVLNHVPALAALAKKTKPTPERMKTNVYISYGKQEEELGKRIDSVIAVLEGKNDSFLRIERDVHEGSHQTAFPVTAVQSVEWLSRESTENESP